MIIAALKWTLLTVVFIGKERTKWGEVESATHIQRRWQNILTKLSGVFSQARKATTPFEAWNCLITDVTLDNTVQHRNQYFLIMEQNFSSESVVKLSDNSDERFHRSSVLRWSSSE
jgi:hypothetical protein